MISKTLFKEYAKCKAFYSLEQIYYLKKKARFDEEEILELLGHMFDEDGNDQIRIEDEKLNAMQGYYKEVEKVALKEASKTLKKEFKYYDNNKEQMKISFFDQNGYEFYTYLDGFCDDQEVTIIEVKATTSRKYLKLGPVINKKLECIFNINNNIITLKEDVYNDKKKMKHYQKLFNRYTDVGKYIYDIGVTAYFLRRFMNDNYKMMNKPVKLYLALLNGDYTYDGKSDYEYNGESIIHFLDVTKICEEYQSIIEKDYQNIVKNIFHKETKGLYNDCCKECIYNNVCFPFLSQKNNIKTLLSPKKITIDNNKLELKDLINHGYCFIKDIPNEYLENKKHLIQYHSILNNEEYLDVKSVLKEINENIRYPIYHLDFESFQSPLPRFKGEKPYTQSVFQFSIHIQKSPLVCDKEKDNYSFLPKDFFDHREELIQEMIRIIDLSNGGTILVYNKNFEYTRIREMIEIFPQYEKELNQILLHMYDLMDVLKKGIEGINYYHPMLNGSYSIKKLLPIYSDISYNDLEVKNGCEAQVAYLQFSYLAKEDIEKLHNELIVYCKQDTYSMVEILDGLIKKVRSI